MQVQVVQVGPLQTNCYLVVCPKTKEGAVIDPGWSGELLYEMIVDQGITLRQILLTHGHFDHVAGAAALKRSSSAPVAGHADIGPWLTQAEEHARFWGFDIEPVPPIDVQLTEGQSVDVGEFSLKVLYTPGHAPGHISFYTPEARAVFDGDVLFSGGIGRTDLPGGNMALLMESIHQKLLTLPEDTTVYSGHGPATTIGQERQWNPYLRRSYLHQD